MEPQISIVVLTKNGCHYIGEVLEAVFSHQARHPFEVVLIDSGSTDGTWEAVQQFPVQAHRIPPEEFNHGETRNLGGRLGSQAAPYLVYLTQDATPLEGWLDNLIRPLAEDEQVAGAFSRHVPRPGCAPSMARLMCTEWAQSGTPERVVKRIVDLDEYEQRQAYYAYFSDTSSVLRREVWRKHPFARVDFAEDAEWADRVLRAGYTLVYEPDSQVLHSHNYSLRQQLAQNVDHAMAMKRYHDPPEYRTVQPSRTLGRIVEQTRKDWAYIAGLEASGSQKASWYLHAPLWQLVTELGSLIGAHADSLPTWLIRNVSRQAYLRQA